MVPRAPLDFGVKAMPILKLPIEPSFTPTAVISQAVEVYATGTHDVHIGLNLMFERLNTVYPGILAQYRWALVDAGLIERPL